MSKKLTIAVLAACAAVALPLGARAQEEESAVSASLDVTAASAYVWRGQVLNEDAVLQPALSVAKGGLSFSWWGNINLTDDLTGHEFEFSEHDFTIAYDMTCPLTGAGISLGVVNFDFPNSLLDAGTTNASLVNDTREAFISFSFADVLLAPSLTVNYDFKEADGFYLNLGIGHSFAFCNEISLDLAATLGFADSDWAGFYYASETVDVGSDLTDYSVSASLPVAITDNLTLTPAVSYVGLLADAKDAVDADGLYYGETEYVSGTLTLSYAF